MVNLTLTTGNRKGAERWTLNKNNKIFKNFILVKLSKGYMVFES